MRPSSRGKPEAAPSTRDFEKLAKVFKDDITQIFGGTLEKCLEATGDADATKAASEIRHVFDAAQRQALSLGQALSEADIELNRKSLKAQDLAFKLKLEASRTAASVQMKNQAAELEANAQAEMARKRQEMLDGGDQVLRDAMEEVERLQKLQHDMKAELQKSEKALKDYKASSEKELEKVSTELSDLWAKRAEEQEEHEQEIDLLEEKLRRAEEAAEEAEERIQAEVERALAAMKEELEEAALAEQGAAARRSKEDLDLARAEIAKLKAQVRALTSLPTSFISHLSL